MAIYDGYKVAAEDGLLDAAKLCCLAALKAPKVGRTEIKTAIVTGEDLNPIVDVLEIIGEASTFVKGDAVTVKRSIEAGFPPVALLIGVDASTSNLAWNCGACGFASCKEFNAFSKENAGMGVLFGGPSCNWKLMDHGIAMSWAAAAAAQYNVDNRLQASVGVGAALLGYLPGCTMCVAVTMGPPGSAIYYNRSVMKSEYTDQDITDMLQRNIPSIFEGFPGDGMPKIKHSPNWFEEPRFSRVQDFPELESKGAEIMEKLQDYLTDFHGKKQLTE